MADAGAKRREERVKLFATALSNVGVATIVTGVVSPIVLGRVHALGDLLALCAGMILHFVAQLLLHYVAVDPPLEPVPGQAGPETLV